VRGLGLRIATPDGQEWRSAMIDAPVFPASTPQAFHDLLLASKSTHPDERTWRHFAFVPL
jgi:catalase